MVVYKIYNCSVESCKKRLHSISVLLRSLFLCHFSPLKKWYCRHLKKGACICRQIGGCRMLWHQCRCGALIPQNMKMCSTCEAGKGNRMSRHMEYNMYRRDKKAAAFYICDEWRKTRAFTLQLYDGLDIYAYYVQHRIVTADMVHHVVEIEEDWNRRLDITNLLPLSNGNHGIISALYKKDEATRRQTQQLLFSIIAQHWEDHGGIENVLTNRF